MSGSRSCVVLDARKSSEFTVPLFTGSFTLHEKLLSNVV